MNMMGYYKDPEGTRRCLHRGWLLPHRRHLPYRARRPAENHRPRQGAVQDQQRQVRRARADREQADGASGRGGLLPDGRRPSRAPSPSSCFRKKARRETAATRKRRRPSSNPCCAQMAHGQLPSSIPTSGSLHRHRRWPLDRRQRTADPHAEDQAKRAGRPLPGRHQSLGNPQRPRRMGIIAVISLRFFSASPASLR